MRGVWLVLLLVAASTAGCFDFLETGPAKDDIRPADVVDDPATYRISGYRVWGDDREENSTVAGADGTMLSYKVYEPLTRDARPNGDPIMFPVVYLFHGWGLSKEYFENAPMSAPGQDDPDARVNLMARFAEAGFITVAYDIRGFGRSEGSVTLAGAADLMDFLAVRALIDQAFPNSGKVGVAGPSLGGGMTMRMLVDSGVVDAAANLFGWIDLYDALMPGDVPKAEWIGLLYGVGQAGSRARLHSDINDWLVKAVSRTDLESVAAAVAPRSSSGRLAQSDVPLFLCQGLHESLFPQADRAWREHGGFVRTYIYTGGHASEEPACWDKTVAWMDFFLRGLDTQVQAWPFVDTADHDPTIHRIGVSRAAIERAGSWQRFLHEENLVAGPSQRTFTVTNRVVSNPLQEPAGVSDTVGHAKLPEQLRRDDAAVFFDSGPLPATEVLLGTPVLRLVPTNATRDTAFQVAATLYAVDEDGGSRVVSRGAYAHLAYQGPAPETIEVAMDWTKATAHAGSRIVLKLSANDLGHYLAMPPDQQPPGAGATFTGASSLTVPLFTG